MELAGIGEDAGGVLTRGLRRFAAHFGPGPRRAPVSAWLIIQAAHCQQLKAKLRDAVQHAIKGRLV